MSRLVADGKRSSLPSTGLRESGKRRLPHGRSWSWFGVWLLLLLAVCGCDQPVSGDAGKGGEAGVAKAAVFEGESPIKATVTVGMVADLVREIGGKHVSVRQLMSSGIDPHLYKPTRDDVSALVSADIVFFNGLLLEGKMSEILDRSSSLNRAFAVAEALPPSILSQDPAEQTHADPHVWMDVSLWMQAAEAVRDELQRFDQQHAADYDAAAEKLLARMERLHAYGQEVIGCVPEEQRVLITSHDAFRYFGAAYGIEVQAVQGISTESEAGLRRINELVDLIVERRISAVFVESSVPRESIQALLRGAASRGHEVEIAGSLFSDAMGESGTYKGTYIGMMDHNFTTIAKALGCRSMPEAGFRDWSNE